MIFISSYLCFLYMLYLLDLTKKLPRHILKRKEFYSLIMTILFVFTLVWHHFLFGRIVPVKQYQSAKEYSSGRKSNNYNYAYVLLEF